MNPEKIGAALKKILPRTVFNIVKNIFYKIRGLFRKIQRKSIEQVLVSDLVRDLKVLPFSKEEIMMIHSSLSSIGNVKNGALGVVASLKQAFPEGTLLMPAYAQADECQRIVESGGEIDLRNQKSLTGKITEEFRKSVGTKISSHPFSAVCGVGKYSSYILSGHGLSEDICHKDSPLGRLLEKNGKILCLGVSVGPISFYHVLEDTWEEFPIKPYLPAFKARYISGDGLFIERLVRRYDPSISKTRIDQAHSDWLRKKLTEHLDSKGLLHYFKFGSAKSFWISARDLYIELKYLAECGITIYSTESDWKMKRGLSSLNKQSPFMKD